MGYIKLKDAFSIKKGKKVEVTDNINENTIRCIQIGDLRNNENLKYCLPSDKHVIVNKNDVLIAWDGANAGTVGVGLEGALGSTLAKLELKVKELNPYFVALLLQSKFDYFQQTATGATIPHISRKALEEISLPILPLEEQNKIVNIIQRVKTLIEKRQFQIMALDELNQSMFLEMFGNPIKNDKSWLVDKLENVIEPGTPVSYGIVQTGDDTEEGVPVIRPVDFTKKINIESLKKTTFDISNSYSRTILNGNELLVTVRANIGSVMLSRPEMKGINVTRGVTPLTFNNELINRYFALALFRSVYMQRLLKELAKGITLIQLNMRDLREIPIIKPPLDKQQDFMEKYLMIEKLKEDLISSKKELENLYNYLLQKAFQGELLQKK